MIPQPITTTLENLKNTGTIKSYAHARSLNAVIEDASLALPRILYHPLKEESTGNRLATTATSQIVTVYFVLVFVCPDEQLDATRETLMQSLIGQVFDNTKDVSEVIHVEGEVLEVSASNVWWRDVFSFRRERRVIS